MADFGDQGRQCPFYKSTNTRGRPGIICEGLIGETTRHGFRDCFYLEVHQRKYCDSESGYKLCRHAMALFRKHGYQPPGNG